MELKDIKKGLFGFKKNSVIEYVSELNRTCVEKTEAARQEKAEAFSELSKTNQELNERVLSLEMELDELKKQLLTKDNELSDLSAENEQLKNSTDAQKAVEKEVADIFTEARKFAQAIREKTIREDEARRLENQRVNDAEQLRLAQYGRRVSEVKEFIDSVLKNAQGELEKAEAEISALEAEANEQGA